MIQIFWWVHIGNDWGPWRLHLFRDKSFSSCHSVFTPELYLLGVRRGFQGAAVVLGVHHGHVGTAVVQHLLHAVHAAALAACADWGAGDGVVAAQAVHLAASCLAVLYEVNTQSQNYTQEHSDEIYVCMCVNAWFRGVFRLEGLSSVWTWQTNKSTCTLRLSTWFMLSLQELVP